MSITGTFCTNSWVIPGADDGLVSSWLVGRACLRVEDSRALRAVVAASSLARRSNCARVNSCARRKRTSSSVSSPAIGFANAAALRHSGRDFSKASSMAALANPTLLADVAGTGVFGGSISPFESSCRQSTPPRSCSTKAEELPVRSEGTLGCIG